MNIVLYEINSKIRSIANSSVCVCVYIHTHTHRVIQNDCRGFNNLSYTIHLVLQMQPPCDFFLWGYVKDQVYVPPLPASIPELKVVTCYKQFGTNSVIVFMFVESQRVHI